jgi:hypothetical protein
MSYQKRHFDDDDPIFFSNSDKSLSNCEWPYPVGE